MNSEEHPYLEKKRAHGHEKRVLILNDDLKIAKAIKYSLQNESTEAYYADSVQDALFLSCIYAGAW